MFPWDTAIKALGIWLLMVLAAIANGLFRQQVLAPNLGSQSALPVSGLILSLLIFLVCFIFIPLFGQQRQQTFLRIGLFWLLLTLGFEFLFGHYVVGKSWSQLAQVFQITKGDFFLLVLIVTACSPMVAARIRSLIIKQ